MVGHEQGVAPAGDVVGPGLDHLVHSRLPGRRRVHAALHEVPGDGAGQVPRTQVVQGMALGRVGLAQVVHERPDVVGVAGSQGF